MSDYELIIAILTNRKIDFKVGEKYNDGFNIDVEITEFIYMTFDCRTGNLIEIGDYGCHEM